MNVAIIPERLKSLRLSMNITQQKAAELINVSQPAYQRYETGARQPSIQIAREIASIFNTSVSYLTGESDEADNDYIIISRKDSPLLYSVAEKCKGLDLERLERLDKYFSELK